jgi:hypothetical protein
MKRPLTAVETGSGLSLDLAQPSVSQISVIDIVHSLAMTPRLLGAVNNRYSIAQHVLHMFDLLTARGVSADRLCLRYFVTQSHVPYIGDIPSQVLKLHAMTSVLADLIRKLHYAVRKHIEERYSVPTHMFARPNEDESRAVASMSRVLRAYESFHLLQGGGWSMQLEPQELVTVAGVLWEKSKYRLDFDRPPQWMDERTAHAKLLNRVNELITTPKSAAA